MIIVTVLREKLLHSETIREKQTIKSDRSDDIWCRGRVQFTLVSVNGRKWKIVAFLPEVEISDIRFWSTRRGEAILKPGFTVSVDWFQSGLIPEPINDDK